MTKGKTMTTKMYQAMILIVVLVAGASGRTSASDVYTLEDAYRAALGSNEYVKIAEENVVQADDRVDQAWTYLYPRLTASGSYKRFNDTLPPGGGSTLFQPLEQKNAALVLTQPLYTGGRTLAALRSAKKMRETSKSGLSVAKQEIVLRVSEAYYGVLKAQKAVEISERSLERMERHKKVTEREASTRKNKANASALLRANALVSMARISMIRSQDGLKVAREKLSMLTKLPMDMNVIEPRPLEQPSDELARLKETALKNRDDYAGAQGNQVIAKEYVTIVQGSHYPQISAEAGALYQASHPATALDATTYYGGLFLKIPLFEGGLMKSEVAEARSKQRQAELSTDFLRATIESEVHEAYVNLQTVTSVLDTAKLQMAYAKDNYEAVESLFTEGLLASLSVIDAEQALTNAERELMNTMYDRQVAILRLKKSIGMLGKDT